MTNQSSLDDSIIEMSSPTHSMLQWLGVQPNQSSCIYKTPYPVSYWRALISRGLVEAVKENNRLSRIKLKNSASTEEPLEEASDLISVSPDYIYCDNKKPPLARDNVLRTNQPATSKVISTHSPSGLSAQKAKLPATNQGRGAEIKWKHLSFRSNHEVAIAKELDSLGVMFFPNAAVRLTVEGKRVTKEVDFLVCKDARWGILEVDGSQHRESRAEDQVRDDAFTDHGVWFIRRYTAQSCMEQPTFVAQDFIRRLEQYYSRLK